MEPSSGPPGSTITVTGEKFIEGEVDLYWDELSSASHLATAAVHSTDGSDTGGFSVDVTVPEDGSAEDHAIVARSSPDADGNHYQAAASFEVVAPPTAVSVEATVPEAGEPGDDGEFTFTRSGDTSLEVTAGYAVSGSATAGADYQQLPDEVTFPAESATVRQPVAVVDDDEVEDEETVTTTVEGGEGYHVGEPASATVTIADDDADGGGTADSDGSGGTAGGETGTDTAQTGSAPARLMLIPQEATSPVGEAHAVIATVVDAEGNAVSEVSVVFVVSGANTAAARVSTDGGGEASFTYTGENAGEDAVTAFADTDGDGARGAGEPADTAAKTWEAVEDEEAEDQAAAAAAQGAGSDGPVSACADEFVPAAGFTDVAGGVHESAIDCLAWYAIALGVSDGGPQGASGYAPDQAVTRGQMASFLARLADEADLQVADAADAFGDDDGSVHEGNINTLAALGVTEGKGDFDGDGQADYAPREPVTRAQMASFLARLAEAAGLDLPGEAPDAFGDDDGSVHEASVNALAALGVTEGKGDLDGDGEDEYAPREPVNRGQMASFIARELGLLVDAGVAEPGGADVTLDDATQGGELSGAVVANKQLAEVVADGCGVADQALDVAGDGDFTVSLPDDQPAGDCQLTVTVTTQRPDANTDGQTVPYTFDVTVPS